MIPFVRKLTLIILSAVVLCSSVLPVYAQEGIPEETAGETVVECLEEITEEQLCETMAEEETEPIAEETREASVLETVEEALPEKATQEETPPEEESPEEAPEETCPEETCPQEESPVPDVPLYFQTDYPETRYAEGTVATSGCGITSVAMVASFLTGHGYQPDELACWFGRYGYNNVERVEYASDILQLPYRKARDIHDILEELEKGNVAIVLMSESSQFTDSQHFVVLKGITEEGNILVNDPYAPNYEKWELMDGYANGFSFHEIVTGYSGGWIYDVQAMPEEPFIYESDLVQPFVEHWKEMPVYYQDDYPNDRFGEGTIATSGCAITSLAMVASYMTEHEYLPDMLADWFGGSGANNMERLEHASDILQLPYRKAENIHEVLEEVRTGNLAILLMNSESVFTGSQHFIVLTGLNQNGRFMVADSYKPNYEKYQLKNGFENGFTEEELVQGYDGGWIYEITGMPEDPFIYVEEKPAVEQRYPEIELTWEEQQLLAKVIWVEARGESPEGQQAIAEIVFNRMISENFPDQLHDVIYAENQFRSVAFLEDATPWQAQYDAIDNALEGPYILPEDVFYFATYSVNDKVWGKIGGHVFCYD